MRLMGGFLIVMAMVAVGCQRHLHSNMPPADMMMHPGPGVDGPARESCSTSHKPRRWGLCRSSSSPARKG